MEKPDLHQYRIAAESITRAAGKILLRYFGNADIKDRKSDYGDVTTQADLESEKYIISEIKKSYPDHQILAEESGNTGDTGDFRWIIDPLDGTREYSRGIPLFNVSIALEHKGELLVSAIYRPISRELFSAEKSFGALKNGKSIQTSQTDVLANAILSTQFPFYKNEDEQIRKTFLIFNKLVKKIYRIRPFMEAAANLC